MDDELREILRRVRKIELLTRRRVQEQVAGEYHATYKGQGIDFEDFREYQPGDDTRAIDWNVTARLSFPYIKKFTEERELNVLLAIDISASTDYGSIERSKREAAAETAAVIAFSALQNQDKTGLLLFTDRHELFLPPKKGTPHTLRLIREILARPPQGHGTNFAPLAPLFLTRLHRRSLIFLFSDFLHPLGLDALRGPARKHDIVAVQITDPAERELPDVGRARLLDPETGRARAVNTSSPQVRQAFAQAAQKHQDDLAAELRRAQIDHLTLSTNDDPVRALTRFFKAR